MCIIMPVLSCQCEAWPLAINKQESSKANNWSSNRKQKNSQQNRWIYETRKFIIRILHLVVVVVVVVVVVITVVVVVVIIFKQSLYNYISKHTKFLVYVILQLDCSYNTWYMQRYFTQQTFCTFTLVLLLSKVCAQCPI